MKLTFKKLTGAFFISFLLLSFSTTLKAQIISTIAGSGTPPNNYGYTGNGGPATQATLDLDTRVALDDSGNVFISDSHNHTIRKVSTKTGIITVVAGNGLNNGSANGTYSGDGGPATNAGLSNPQGVYIDDSENVYIADYSNFCVRKVTAKTGIINTIAGIPQSGGYSGDGGPATSAQLGYPTAVTLDDSGNIIITDQWNWCIREVSAKTGIITTVAGNQSKQYSFGGNGGPATDAALYWPTETAVDDSGNLYIADQHNNEIRKVTKATGIITDFAGSPTAASGYSGDGGPAIDAEFNNVCGIFRDDSGNIFIADASNNVIRKISTRTGIITTIAGMGPSNAGYNGDGIAATAAELNSPIGVTTDPCGNIYIADYNNNFVRKVTVSSSGPLTVSATSPSICSGGADTITVAGGSNYIWSPATGLNTTEGSMVIANPTVTTTYTVNGSSMCVGAAIPDTIVVTVTAAPPFTITQQPSQPTCSGQPVTLSISGGGSDFTWSPSTGLSTTSGSSVIATPSDTTIYVVNGTNSGGCKSQGTDTINIIPAPPLTILPQPDPLFCSGLSAELKVQGGGSNFIWTPITGLSDTTSGDSVLAAPLVTTTYYVSGYDSLGCLSNGSESVTVIISPNKPTFYQHGDTLTSSATTDNQWYMDGQPLNGDTSQNLIIYNTSPDSFYVVVENEANGCSTSSDTTATTGINQLSLIGNQLSLYPNPFNTNIFIEINSSAQDVKDWNLQIIDVLGRTVYSQQSLDYNNDIDLLNLASGMYFMTVVNKFGRVVFPILKQNY